VSVARVLLATLLFLAAPAQAVERVTAFHSDIRIAASGEITVTETIEVQAEGKEISRGILRDFPSEHRDRLGNRMTVPLAVDKVVRNRKPEHYALERLSNGTRIRIGEANRKLPHGKHVYEITYRTARQIGYFDTHDELYWNVNGTSWTYPFDGLTAEVTFERPVAAAELKVEAYTGPKGPRAYDYNAFVRHGSAAFRASRPLAPREAMTIVVAFPKGVIGAPSTFERSKRYVAAHGGVAVGAGIFGLMLALLLTCWWRFGRDPAPGPRLPRYEPPARLGPAGVRYLDAHGYDARCLSAALLGLASRGYVRIRELGERFRVERTGKEVEWFPGEQALARRLVPAGTRQVEMKKQHDRVIQNAREAFSKALAKHFGRLYWSSNLNYALIAGAIGVVGILAMVALQTPLVAIAWVGGATLATLLVFAIWLLPVYTKQGRRLQDEIDGLRQYLSATEADERARLKPPPQTKEEFSRLLPYAVALGVEKSWAERFTALLGAPAVAAALSEYYQSEDPERPGAISESISRLGEAIALASSPPSPTPVRSSDRARARPTHPSPHKQSARA
jgi:hypothetical protein